MRERKKRLYPHNVRFRRTEIVRLMRSIEDAGLVVERVECDSSGRVILFPAKPSDQNRGPVTTAA
jgi:hypothetical protein